MKSEKIACIGIGNMGGAIMKAVCKNYDPKNITVTNRTFEKAEKFAEENGCNAVKNNTDAVKNADYIFLAVKPYLIEDVVKEIVPAVKKGAIIISMAAGVPLEKYFTLTSTESDLFFIRIMPNLPAKVGESMTALCCEKDIPEEKILTVKAILESCGKVEIIPEKLMDCVTAISGSGPAYAFMFIEALTDAAVLFGMPRKTAYIYAAQTLKGSAQMVLESGLHPAELKDAVCSPGGTTIEAVKILEEEKFRGAIIDAATAAFQKSINLGK